MSKRGLAAALSWVGPPLDTDDGSESFLKRNLFYSLNCLSLF